MRTWLLLAAGTAGGLVFTGVHLARRRAYIGFALANPGRYRYLFSQHTPTGDPARPLVSLPTFQALAESIGHCQQAGLARDDDRPQWTLVLAATKRL